MENCECKTPADCTFGCVGRRFQLCRGTASNVSAERQTKFRDLLQYGANVDAKPSAAAGTVTVSQTIPAPGISDTTCKHRGPETGSADLRACCGVKRLRPVPAYRCELLDTVCVLAGQPAEAGVESCATCADREPVAD